MSTPTDITVLKGFPGRQLFVTGDPLEVSAAVTGITMAVADADRGVDGQIGLDPLYARRGCSVLVRVNAADGAAVKSLGHDNFQISVFRDVSDWASVPVTRAQTTDASIHAPPDFDGQLDGVYLLNILATDDFFDDGTSAFKGAVNYLHQIVMLVQVTSYTGTKPITISKGRAFATMPFYYTAFTNGKV